MLERSFDGGVDLDGGVGLGEGLGIRDAKVADMCKNEFVGVFLSFPPLRSYGCSTRRLLIPLRAARDDPCARYRPSVFLDHC